MTLILVTTEELAAPVVMASPVHAPLDGSGQPVNVSLFFMCLNGATIIHHHTFILLSVVFCRRILYFNTLFIF